MEYFAAIPCAPKDLNGLASNAPSEIREMIVQTSINKLIFWTGGRGRGVTKNNLELNLKSQIILELKNSREIRNSLERYDTLRKSHKS